jgi:hypothetical protein
MIRVRFFHLISINHEVQNESDYFVKPEILITIQIEIKNLVIIDILYNFYTH